MAAHRGSSAWAQIRNTGAHLLAALPLPAPAGMFTQFVQPCEQLTPADEERVATARGAEAAEQMKGCGFAQIKQGFDCAAVDALVRMQMEGF